jgi:hypothetical protein
MALPPAGKPSKKNPCQSAQSVIKKSIKTVGSCTPKTANFKKILLLFSHRVTRDERQATITIFDSIAHVRPIVGGSLFSK